MQTKLIVALAALALAGPGIAVAASAGSAGGGGGSGGNSGSSSGGSSYSGGGSGGSSGSAASSGGHGGGGGGSAHGGAAAGGGGFASRGGGAVAGYGIRVGPHDGGRGAPAIQQLTHGAAHAVGIEHAAHAMPVEDRIRPRHPHPPRVPYTRTQYLNLYRERMPDLYCADPRVDDLFSTPLDCPRAFKIRDLSDTGTPTR